MFQSVCLLLVCCLGLAVAQQPVKDDSVDIEAVRPGDVGSTSGTLKLRCSFDVADSHLIHAFQITIEEANEDDIPDRTIAELNPFEAANFLGEHIIDVTGDMNEQGASSLEVTWQSGDDGYKQNYMCIVIGWDQNRAIHILYDAVKVY